MAAHRADDLAAQHERTQVVAGMAHDPLKVNHGTQTLERVKGAPGDLAIADPHEPSAFGAKERLDHDVASQAFKGRQSFIGGFTGPGRGHGEPGGFKQRQCQILVNRRFDRARRVEDRHAQRRQAMQGIHAEDDLLEAPRRHHPHQDAIGGRQINLAGARPVARRRSCRPMQ